MPITRVLAMIAYDIVDAGDRRRVAEVLEAHMQRVQDSLFEGLMPAAAAETLAAAAAKLIVGNDSLRLYIVPQRAIARCRAWGFPPAPDPDGFLIL